MEIVGSLPNLEIFKINNCSVEDCKWETNEGEFPRLKFLQIIDTNLHQWITESSHFPRLARLTLCNCQNLGDIPDVIGEIPTLELIEVYIKDKSLVESAKRIKEEQQSFGNDCLQRVAKMAEAIGKRVQDKGWLAARFIEVDLTGLRSRAHHHSSSYLCSLTSHHGWKLSFPEHSGSIPAIDDLPLPMPAHRSFSAYAATLS
ncbi:hypothetical protein BUALT_Bualt06G0006500 [Buddleja alternifolia]|uniref:Uncharacterized protein n=1 Tax=Buddleja alternifolia TaxID=168488 RepID=A0AAV6XB71_9LAMI|nr:hypothetical protein BUALT_Bualt06G0006500 [Buddleja alternifolia]